MEALLPDGFLLGNSFAAPRLLDESLCRYGVDLMEFQIRASVELSQHAWRGVEVLKARTRRTKLTEWRFESHFFFTAQLHWLAGRWGEI